MDRERVVTDIKEDLKANWERYVTEFLKRGIN